MPRLRFAGWSRGDTMIEVLLAITIFSAVSIGALTIVESRRCFCSALTRVIAS